MLYAIKFGKQRVEAMLDTFTIELPITQILIYLKYFWLFELNNLPGFLIK